LIDILVLVVILALAVLGWYTGLIRRVVGFFAMYASFFVATHLDPTAASVLQQGLAGWSTPDALTYSYLAVTVILYVILEVLATTIHRQLQLAPVALDKATGVVVGAISGFAGCAVMLWLLWASVQPNSFVSPDARQIDLRNSIHDSATGVGLASNVGHPLSKTVFLPVVPEEPAQFFNGAHTGA
jgi:uncharacterized membrane protein required for colicin V production